jgi:predicted RNA-binding Zn-ribbon protein involved in translation (DUF1610 family)
MDIGVARSFAGMDRAFSNWSPMSILKPVPIIPQTVKNLCPICGQTTYSRGGIHPQCAVQQADAPRNARIRAEKKKKESEVTTVKPRQRSWSKKCPSCGIQVHVRLGTCACGHSFS